MIVGQKYRVLIAVLKNGDQRVVHDLPHDDPDTGQNRYHYHRDSRFDNDVFTRFDLRDVAEVFYDERECIASQENSPTDSTLLRKHKFKNKCLIRGKCAHKGYDLTQIQPVMTPDGMEIVCPMHGLRFKAETGKMIPIPDLGLSLKLNKTPPRKTIKHHQPKINKPWQDYPIE